MSVIIESRMYRTTYDNERLEDLSDYVVEATVTADPARDVTWVLDATLTREGWERLTPYEDWLAPVMTITYPDGTVRRGQLGLYLVLDSTERHDEYTATVQIEARDPLWLLSMQGYGYRLTADDDNVEKKPALTIDVTEDRLAVVRAVLDSAVLTESRTGKRRYVIPGRGGRVKRKREWPRKTPLLDICNDLLQAAGYYPLWTTSRGVFTSRPRGGKDADDDAAAKAQNRQVEIARLRDRQPVRTYSANVPEGYRLVKRQRPIGGVASEIVGQVELRPGPADLDNEIVIVVDSPDTVIREARVEVNPGNPRRKQAKQGRRSKKIRYNRGIDDDVTAKRVADALADELSAQNKLARITVIPDPETDFLRETVGLAIWNANGERVAVGQYVVNTVSYGFTPASALMTLDLGRIDDAQGILVEE